MVADAAPGDDDLDEGEDYDDEDDEDDLDDDDEIVELRASKPKVDADVAGVDAELGVGGAGETGHLFHAIRADLLRTRFEKAARRFGLPASKFGLRRDLFQPPQGDQLRLL